MGLAPICTRVDDHVIMLFPSSIAPLSCLSGQQSDQNIGSLGRGVIFGRPECGALVLMLLSRCVHDVDGVQCIPVCVVLQCSPWPWLFFPYAVTPSVMIENAILILRRISRLGCLPLRLEKCCWIAWQQVRRFFSRVTAARVKGEGKLLRVLLKSCLEGENCGTSVCATLLVRYVCFVRFADDMT